MKASLFITCLVDQFFPEVGESTVNVLRKLGVDVSLPLGQTCCGQPAYNSGFNKEALSFAEQFITVFQDSENIVVPSGSCASMIKVFMPEMLANHPTLAEPARALANRTYEFSQFLVNVLGVSNLGAARRDKVTYHASCHLLRELKASNESKLLIRNVKGSQFLPMRGEDECCGFGGSFSIKFPDISNAILNKKLANIKATKAETVLACDSGCLMQIAGGLSRQKINARVMHLAQFLDQESS